MAAAVVFFDHLFQSGEAVLYERAAVSREERAGVVRLLEAAYSEYRLDVAGPLLPFDAEAAFGAAMFLAYACWFLVSGDGSPDELQKTLHFPLNPATPEPHLSADLSLRYLATVHRRLRTRRPDDPLLAAVTDALRRWPLSGALEDVADGPAGDLKFHDHYGLQLLYAERLAASLRPAWIPTVGRTREALELVLQEQGKSLPAAPAEEAKE